MRIKTLALDKIKPYERNPRRNDQAVDAVAESIRQCGYCAPIVVDENGVILAGHTRFKALQKLGWATVKVCVAEGMSEEQKRKYRILDNKTGELAEWDNDLLALELDGLDFEGFDFGLLDMALPESGAKDDKPREAAEDDQETDGAEAEAQARAEAEAEGLDEDDPEYQAFVDKFKPKKTTDDCYTPPMVYNAVADFVAQRYGLDRADFVRPFQPGGDYQSADYRPEQIVVDNPPFSILSEIVAWYIGHGVRFFLFAPTLTLFSSSSSSSSFCAALPVGASVTYENGANVNTSFLTNLEPEDVRVAVVPNLYQAVNDANARNLAENKNELPKYIYPDEVLTAAAAAKLCKYGQALTLRTCDTEFIRALDAQKESGASIYGSGYLLSKRAAAERAAAERWALSDRERKIVRRLGNGV